MADRPILFSAPMVRALLDGRKTQTRRALKVDVTDTGWLHLKGPGGFGCLCEGDENFAMIAPDFVRFAIGDRLWMREEYYQFGHWERVHGAVTKGGRPKWSFVGAKPMVQFDRPVDCLASRNKPFPGAPRWYKRLGRFMPRWASRLTLLVDDVRVERLQDISEADAIAEGIEDVTSQVASGDRSLRFWRRYRDGGWNGYVDHPVASYASLWTEINGAGAWEANPWVVAVTFRPVLANIDRGPA